MPSGAEAWYFFTMIMINFRESREERKKIVGTDARPSS